MNDSFAHFEKLANSDLSFSYSREDILIKKSYK